MSGSSGSLPVFQPQQPQNPYAQMQQTIGGVNALMDFQGKRATADAYGQSIDPQTGAFNQGGFNALLASTPQGRWNIGPSMQQSGQAQSAEGFGQQQQMEAARQQLSGISAYMQPLLNKTLGPNPQPVTGQDVLSTMDQVPDGLVTPQMKANIQKQVASIGGPTGDATNLVRGANFATMTAQEQLKTLYPPTQAANLGSTVQPYQPSPLAPGGAGSTGRGVGATTSLTPGEATDLVQVNMGDGTVQQMTRGDAATVLSGRPDLQRLNPAVQSGGAVTNQSFGPNQGRYAPPPGTTPGTGGAPGGGPGGAPGGGTPAAQTALPSDQAVTRAKQTGQPVPIANGNGLVAYPNGQIGTPSGGFRPAPAAAPAPAPGTGPYVVGDSLGQGIRTAGKFDGTTTAGASPQAVLASINDPKNPLPVNGRDVVLSGGASNNPAQVAMVEQQLQALRAQGAKSVTVVGAADPAVNAQLQAIANRSNARFVPLGAISEDGVHPANYGSLAAAAAPPAAAPPAAPAAPGAQIGRTLPPGVAEARGAPAVASGQAQAGFRADVTASPGRVFTAQQALSALQGSNTGKGTQWASDLVGIIGTYEPAFLRSVLGPNYDPATLSQNRDLAEKYLTQIAMQTANSFGQGTDAKLAASFSANPNVHINNLAAQDVLKVQIGMERMKQDMYNDMRGQRVQPENFSDWQADWVKSHDPRAYALDSMAPDQIARLKASLAREGQRGQDLFASTVREAVGNGRIPDPTGGRLSGQ